MPSIKLLTSYRNYQKGEIVIMDKQKCEELIGLGRAKYIQSDINKQLFGEEEMLYKNKQMGSDDLVKYKTK